MDEAYERAGITEDVATHSRASPTVRDMFDVLEGMSEEPDEYVVRTGFENLSSVDDDFDRFEDISCLDTAANPFGG